MATGKRPSPSIVIVQEKTDTITIKQKQKRGPGTWSTEQEKELINLFQKGTSVETLAEKYKRNPKAVKMKLKRLGLNVVASKVEMTGESGRVTDLLSLEEGLKSLWHNSPMPSAS
jgi:cytolysin (calcineurin-like family phosphatase)